MREYIFQFEQEKALQLKLSVTELLILDYMWKFYNSNCIKVMSKGEKYFFKLSYNKILTDLPILNIKERQLRNILIRLEEKGIIKRLTESKNCMLIHINYDVLIGNILPGQNQSAKNFQGVSNKLPTIDSYDNKNIIKIKIVGARVNYINIENFNIRLHEYLQKEFTDIAYTLFVNELKLLEFRNNILVFYAKWKEHLLKYNGEKVNRIAKEVFEEFNHDWQEVEDNRITNELLENFECISEIDLNKNEINLK